MDEFMDTLWFRIVDGVVWVAARFDELFVHLHPLGGIATIVIIAFATVLVNKLLTRLYKTRRHEKLGVEYRRLRKLRDEALKWEDQEKGKRLARNIDTAELNQVYYNYFFEGLMMALLTKYLPFIAMLAYVNESYRPERLEEYFGRPYLLRFGGGEDPTKIGSLLVFVVAVIGLHILWQFVRAWLKRGKPEAAAQS
jgi:hypothetical protein